MLNYTAQNVVEGGPLVSVFPSPSQPTTMTAVMAEQFTIKQNMPTLDGHNQQCPQKMVHAAEQFVLARDLLYQEYLDKFKQALESDARASLRSIVDGKGKS